MRSSALDMFIKKLFLIQATLEDIDEDVEMEDDGVSKDQVPKILLYAMAGIRAPNTMRVNGHLGRQPIMALIDSGSTHNFVNEQIANSIGLQPTLEGYLGVMVASGERLVSSGKCNQTCINLQGYSLLVDFYWLPLEGCDVVLGTQWLSTLGLIQWDFSKLLMKFELKEKTIVLHGLKNSEDRIINCQYLQRPARKKGHCFQLLGIIDAHSSQPSIPP